MWALEFRTSLEFEANGEETLSQNGLNDLISELQESGQQDSSGQFTISKEKALEKLAQFQLADPRLYSLNLLASAVAGGASFFRASFKGGVFVFEYDGAIYRKSDLEQLFQQILEPTDTATQELAVAMNALRSYPSARVSMETWNGTQEIELELRVDSLFVEGAEVKKTVEEPPLSRVVVTEGFTLKGTLKRWWGVFPEQAVLKNLGRYAPLSLIVDGREEHTELSLGTDSESCFSWSRLTVQSSPYSVVKPSREQHKFCDGDFVLKIPNLVDAVFCLDQPELAAQRGLTIICNGVAFSRSQHPLKVPMAYGVIMGEFRKNLSHSDLADDEHLKSILEKVVAQLELQVHHRLISQVPLPAASIRPLLSWAPTLVTRLRGRGMERQAKEVELWIKETKFLQELRNEAQWRRFREELEHLALAERKERLYLRSQTALRSAALQDFEAGNYHSCRQLCTRLCELEELCGGQQSERWERNVQLAAALAGEKNQEVRDPEIQALLFRIQGEPQLCLSFQISQKNRASAHLAVGQYEQAELEMRRILKSGDTSEILESLADCLSFSPKAGKAQRLEATEFMQRSIRLWEQKNDFHGALLRKDLATLARGVWSWKDWLALRTIILLGKKNLLENHPSFEEAMERTRTNLATSPAAAVSVSLAYLALEKRLHSQHPFLAVARGRTAHTFRRAGNWKQADQILARGDIMDALGSSLADADTPNAE